jgi:hypothetical protein
VQLSRSADAHRDWPAVPAHGYGRYPWASVALPLDPGQNGDASVGRHVLEPAGAVAKGHRFYDWALADIADDRPGHHQLLVRRNRRTGELAFYRCYSATRVPLSTLVRVPALRR